MFLFLRPLFFFIYLILFRIVCFPFYLLYLLVKGFLTSTSSAQLPAYVARQFTKRGMEPEAARWYLRARGAHNYSSQLSFGVLGPRRDEIRRFYVQNRDKLPADLRSLLGNVLWADAVLEDKSSGEVATDNPSIIDVATRLVEAAHRPKETDQITKLRTLAGACWSAPGLREALEKELADDQLDHKFKFEPVSSAVNPERPPAEIRLEKGSCCLCEAPGEWKGLDAYAKVVFSYSRPAPVSGTLEWRYERFLGRLKVLFCQTCVSRSVAEEWHNRERRRALYWAISIPIAAVALAVGLWYADDQGRGNDASNLETIITVLVVVAFLGAGFPLVKSMTKYLPERHEATFYRTRTAQFLDDERQRLVAACDLTGSEIRGIEGLQDVTPKANNISFDIEPGEFKSGGSKVAKGSNGAEWRVI